MTQEEKELVLKDICTRLPYGVHVEISWEYSKTDVYTSSEYYEFPNIDSLLNIFWDEKCISIKPYLRPMSSMTKDEQEELTEFMKEVKCTDEGIFLPGNITGYVIHYSFMEKVINWLNKKGFDYRGLIPMGLALAAPEDMYKVI